MGGRSEEEEGPIQGRMAVGHCIAMSLQQCAGWLAFPGEGWNRWASLALGTRNPGYGLMALEKEPSLYKGAELGLLGTGA